MTTETETTVTTQVYRVYIKATPQAVWDAITTPEWTERYGGERVDFDLRPGGRYRAFTTERMKAKGAEIGLSVPDVMSDGEVVEADPPRKLVHTWRLLMGEGMADEGFTRITWEIDEVEDGLSRVTVIHDLEGAPKIAAMVAGEMEDQGAGGGWSEVLSGLKTVLETGRPLRPTPGGEMR
jgi:uncharacterized protein YndB with AHSA1/START domain